MIIIRSGGVYMELENIKKVIKESAECASKKVCDVTNKAKIKFALANLQSDVDELYEKLGKLHYEAVAYGADTGAKESAIINRIDSIKADMEILKAEVGTFPKKSKPCPRCGKDIPNSSSFCPFCGKEM